MKKYLVLVFLAACGSESAPGDDVIDADVTVTADADTTDADPLAPDATADAFVADATPGQPDAAAVVPDATPAPDAVPPPPIDWVGYHSVNIIEGVSTCAGFGTPNQMQDMLRITQPFPSNTGYLWQYLPAQPTNESNNAWPFTFTWVDGWPTQVALYNCPVNSCTISKWTPVQTGVNTWSGAFVRHELAGFGNPSAPCDYNYTIVGTKL
jgi:hypothetical protein